MNRSDAPAKKSVPFGVNGPREAILDTTPAGNNQASYDVGFPPVTMILKSAGGLPPKGEDFNQILYELALNARWGQAGAGYQFDSEFSTGISGYPIGAILQNSTGDGTWINTLDGNTNNPEVATATPLTGWIPLDSNGVTTKTGLTNSSVTLTTLEASRDRVVLSGTLTANINLVVPAWRKKWTVVNNCSGNFSVTIKTTSGSGIAIPAGLTAYVLGDGTNVIQDTNLLGISGRLLNIQTFSSSGTYTPTAGTKAILVEVQAGGGGGGNATAGTGTTATCGAPGGAGGYASSYLTAVPASAAVVVGAGGAASTSGGNSSFGGTIVAGGGGVGASNVIAGGSAYTSHARGGVGGTATGGNLYNSKGGAGTPAIITGGVPSGGNGGASQLSGSELGGGASGGAGSPGAYGSGGSGASQPIGGSGANGGSGGSGIVIVREYA
ncbi:hypothetical protein [Lelliottia sp. RWM.1]|uniref:glycine-rich domain-containing protein n=1 Tax=Lelliottia sp. RWM.1 TaxID=2663242 RepID=UPI00193E811E|nr:hypothetical protein [Lelliottia sp. RWM.1]MBM3073487.1 hypothetical protein [Lelliottia sp. RWM.1]